MFDRAELAIHSTELPAIVEIANGVGPGKYQMPNEAYRKLVRAVISVGSFCEEQSRREQYWDQVRSISDILYELERNYYFGIYFIFYYS